MTTNSKYDFDDSALFNDPVLALFPNDCYPGQACYPDWDETYDYDSYLNSYSVLSSSAFLYENDPEEIRAYLDELYCRA